MAEPQYQKKNKKSKKKPETPEVTANNEGKNQTTGTSDVNKNLTPEQNTKASGNIKEAVTNDKKEATNETAGKKKKKSKKSKEVSKETSAENNNSQSLLNFSENGIHLLNHPEISVTISDASQLKDEVKSTVDKIQQIDTKQQNNVDNNSAIPVTAATNTPDCSNAAKKKKKKKKKANSDSAPIEPTTTANENTIPTPTYTKVVTSDNTCVLVVNNEKFSLDSKLLQNTDIKKNNLPDKGVNFTLPSDKQLDSVLITKNFTPDTSIQFNNSVSIFPVLTNGNTDVSCMKKESVSEISINTQKAAAAENADESKPTKSQLKAERRAKQEAQRAAKLAKINAKVDSNTSATAASETKNTPSKEKTVTKEISPKISEVTNEKVPTKLPVEKESLHKVKLFSHLPQHKPFNCNSKIHPAILEIGFQYNKGIICGSNARCVALLEAFVEVIEDFNPQPEKSFCKDLESSIHLSLNFLADCRPLSISMKNAVRFLKHEINQIPSDMSIEEIKERLCDFIHNFIKVEIVLAKEAIANRASYKILDGDIILVLAFSSVVRDLLCKAHDKGTTFRVVVVDSRPKLEGSKMLRYLVKQGLQCSYISINAVSYIMKEVTKVVIGAHAVLADGCVMSRLGNKQIALIASMFGVPVFVCCETYKFCELVLRDSFVHNELGDPEDIISTALISNDSLKNWQDLPSLQPLNLVYDLTTPDLISQIITEKSSLPCTSVPVVLKVKFAGLPE